MELSLSVGFGLFAVSFLIGATAIGGLLLVPVLVILGGYTVHEVIPTCLLSIFFSGVVGSLIFGREGHVGLREVSAIALPAGLLAFLGTYLLPLVPSIISAPRTDTTGTVPFPESSSMISPRITRAA